MTIAPFIIAVCGVHVYVVAVPDCRGTRNVTVASPLPSSTLVATPQDLTQVVRHSTVLVAQGQAHLLSRPKPGDGFACSHHRGNRSCCGRRASRRARPRVRTRCAAASQPPVQQRQRRPDHGDIYPLASAHQHSSCKHDDESGNQPAEIGPEASRSVSDPVVSICRAICSTTCAIAPAPKRGTARPASANTPTHQPTRQRSSEAADQSEPCERGQ